MRLFTFKFNLFSLFDYKFWLLLELGILKCIASTKLTTLDEFESLFEVLLLPMKFVRLGLDFASLDFYSNQSCLSSFISLITWLLFKNLEWISGKDLKLSLLFCIVLDEILSVRLWKFLKFVRNSLDLLLLSLLACVSDEFSKFLSLLISIKSWGFLKFYLKLVFLFISKFDSTYIVWLAIKFNGLVSKFGIGS